MCKVLYLAADAEMPGVNSKSPAFMALPVKNVKPTLKQHFTQPNVAYIATAGCACGFFWSDCGLEDATRENDPEAFESTQVLIDYLSELLLNCEVVEAFGCWDQEWDKPVDKEVVFSMKDVRRDGMVVIPEQTRVRFVR
ncbi:MAG TPA: hypothetical protein VGH19_23930 [Verrucomicrobiae bacterium]